MGPKGSRQVVGLLGRGPSYGSSEAGRRSRSRHAWTYATDFYLRFLCPHHASLTLIGRSGVTQ